MNLPNNAMLAAWLRARGMKSGAFGKLIPVSKDVISLILTGKRAPKPDIAKRIEQLTGGDVAADKW
jgi:plasmid maintenance system antidote protein VapI